MSLISLIVILVLIGFGMWAVNMYVPMQAGVKRILNIVVIIVVILWLLNIFGIIGAGNISTIRVGR